MPSLITMPPEIRLMIYSHVFYTPTSTIEPISWRTSHHTFLPTAHSRTRPRFFLSTTNTSTDFLNPTHHTNRHRHTSISLSLLRVNTTIHNEAKPLFYSTTTFYFPSVVALSHLLHETLWPATHCIQKIPLSFNQFYQYYTENFSKTIRLLSKRTVKTTVGPMTGAVLRKRTLKSVEIIFTAEEPVWLSQRTRKVDHLVARAELKVHLPMFDDVLDAVVETGDSLMGVEKRIRILGGEEEVEHENEDENEGENEQEDEEKQESVVGRVKKGKCAIAKTLQDLSWAWGGKLILGEEVFWEVV